MIFVLTQVSPKLTYTINDAVSRILDAQAVPATRKKPAVHTAPIALVKKGV